jgi:hypothetical protein
VRPNEDGVDRFDGLSLDEIAELATAAEWDEVERRVIGLPRRFV